MSAPIARSDPYKQAPTLNGKNCRSFYRFLILACFELYMTSVLKRGSDTQDRSGRLNLKRQFRYRIITGVVEQRYEYQERTCIGRVVHSFNNVQNGFSRL